jgi:glycosyltransferase involved in cell wall biosynthesis
MVLCIVIPVYNEADTLPRLIARLDAVPPPRLAIGDAAAPASGESLERRIIIVDDGSTDGTTDLVRQFGERRDIRIILQNPNQGKGAALRAGFRAALDWNADLILIQDGDLEYDPADHEPALRPILDGRADVVIGSRFIGQSHRVMYYWHWVANQIITQFCNMMTNLNLTDIECGIKAFSRDVASQLTITEDRFGVEPEIVARVARMRIIDRARGPADGSGQSGWVAAAPPSYWRTTTFTGRPRRLRIYEVPVSYAGRTYEEGKKIGWRDGISALRCILKYTVLDRSPPRPASTPQPGPSAPASGPPRREMQARENQPL